MRGCPKCDRESLYFFPAFAQPPAVPDNEMDVAAVEEKHCLNVQIPPHSLTGGSGGDMVERLRDFNLKVAHAAFQFSKAFVTF